LQFDLHAMVVGQQGALQFDDLALQLPRPLFVQYILGVEFRQFTLPLIRPGLAQARFRLHGADELAHTRGFLRQKIQRREASRSCAVVMASGSLGNSRLTPQTATSGISLRRLASGT
jgi:hypothetical protein